MRIVAAGVHDAIGLRAVLDVVLLVDRERVHIGANQRHAILARAVASAFDQASDPGLVDASADVFHTSARKRSTTKAAVLCSWKPSSGFS
jgi:hypothetical protein